MTQSMADMPAVAVAVAADANVGGGGESVILRIYMCDMTDSYV